MNNVSKVYRTVKKFDIMINTDMIKGGKDSVYLNTRKLISFIIELLDVTFVWTCVSR